jgi:hypothetical protein
VPIWMGGIQSGCMRMLFVEALCLILKDAALTLTDAAKTLYWTRACTWESMKAQECT